jgi:hypothetical protein
MLMLGAAASNVGLVNNDTSCHNKNGALMYGKVPLNMQMIKEVWLKCDGASGQLQSSKLTSWHFDKNAYS